MTEHINPTDGDSGSSPTPGHVHSATTYSSSCGWSWSSSEPSPQSELSGLARTFEKQVVRLADEVSVNDMVKFSAKITSIFDRVLRPDPPTTNPDKVRQTIYKKAGESKLDRLIQVADEFEVLDRLTRSRLTAYQAELESDPSLDEDAVESLITQYRDRLRGFFPE